MRLSSVCGTTQETAKQPPQVQQVQPTIVVAAVRGIQHHPVPENQ